MASEKVISIISSELKTSKTGKQYLEVIDHDNVKYSCWDEALWNSLGKDVGARIEFEQKGIFKNILVAETMATALAKQKKAENPPLPPDPQEKGMWLKELGEDIRSGQLEKDFPKQIVRIKAERYKKMSEVTGIDFWGKKEP